MKILIFYEINWQGVPFFTMCDTYFTIEFFDKILSLFLLVVELEILCIVRLGSIPNNLHGLM